MSVNVPVFGLSLLVQEVQRQTKNKIKNLYYVSSHHHSYDYNFDLPCSSVFKPQRMSRERNLFNKAILNHANIPGKSLDCKHAHYKISQVANSFCWVLSNRGHLLGCSKLHIHSTWILCLNMFLSLVGAWNSAPASSSTYLNFKNMAMFLNVL